MKPRKNYRTRPKKSGAKRKQRTQSQKRKLIAAGHDAAGLDKLTTVEIRELLKKAGRKKTPKTDVKKVKKPKVKTKK